MNIIKKIKENRRSIIEYTCISFSILMMWVVLCFGAITIANNTLERKANEQTFRIELIEAVKSIQTEIKLHDNTVVFNEVIQSLNRVESKLTVLNKTVSQPPKARVDTIYKIVEIRPVDVPKETFKACYSDSSDLHYKLS
jgi:signal transduction histidine kinase